MTILSVGSGVVNQLEQNVPVEIDVDTSTVTNVRFNGAFASYTIFSATTLLVNMPGGLATGEYVLRVEAIALHDLTVPYVQTHPLAVPATFDISSLFAQINVTDAAYFKVAPLPQGVTYKSPHTAWTVANASLPITDVVTGSATLSAEILKTDGTTQGRSFSTTFVDVSAVVNFDPYPTTARTTTVNEDGRYPALRYLVQRIKAAAQVSITDLAVDTTSTTAILTFTPVPGATQYRFQRAVDGVWGGDKYSNGLSGTIELTGLVSLTTYMFRVLVDAVVSNIVTKATLVGSGGSAGSGDIDPTPPGSFNGIRRIAYPEFLFTDDFEDVTNTSFWIREANCLREIHPQTPGTNGSRSEVFHFNLPGTPIGVNNQTDSVSGDNARSELKFQLPINAVQLEIGYDFFVPNNFVQVPGIFRGFFTAWSGAWGPAAADVFVGASWNGSTIGGTDGPVASLNIGANHTDKGLSTINGTPVIFPNRAGRWYRMDALLECAPASGQFGKVEVKINGQLVIGTHHPDLQVPTFAGSTGAQLLPFVSGKNYFDNAFLFGFVDGSAGAIQEKYLLAIDNLRIAANSVSGPTTTGNPDDSRATGVISGSTGGPASAPSGVVMPEGGWPAGIRHSYSAPSVLARTSGREIFVNKEGNDAASGTTSGTAFMNIQKAESIALPGDKIKVAAGTYEEQAESSPHVRVSLLAWGGTTPTSLVLQTSGTEEYPIYMEAMPGDEHLVLISGQGTRLCVHAQSTDNWQIRGLKFVNAWRVGFAHWGSANSVIRRIDQYGENFVIENNQFIDLNGSASTGNVAHLGMWGSANWIVRNNLFDGVTIDGNAASQSHCIQAYGTVNSLIEHNDIRNSANGIYWKDHHVKNENRDKYFESEIRYNLIETTNKGLYVSATPGEVEAGHNYFHHNIVRGAVEGGFHGNQGYSSYASGSMQIEHNLFDGMNKSGSLGVRLHGEKPASLKGNIFINNDRDIWTKNSNSSTQPNGKGNPDLIYSNYNVFNDQFKASIDVYSVEQRNFSSLGGWQSAKRSPGSCLLIDNPDSNSTQAAGGAIVTSVTGADYSLKAGSPAIGLMPDGSNAGPYQFGNEIIGRTV